MFLQFRQSGKCTHLVEGLVDFMTRKFPPCGQILEHGSEIGRAIRRYAFESLSAEKTEAVIDMGHSLSVRALAVGTDFTVGKFDIAKSQRPALRKTVIRAGRLSCSNRAIAAA